MTECEAVEQLKNGDPHQGNQAFHELFETHSGAVFRYLCRMTGRKETAEDLLQETFMTVIQKIGFFNPQSGDASGLRSWIFRIATNLAIDVLRRDRKQEPLPDILPETIDSRTPHEAAVSLEQSATLLRALDLLPDTQRLFLILKEQQGMSCLEISRVCGCSTNAVKQGLFRARVTMRKLLCT